MKTVTINIINKDVEHMVEVNRLAKKVWGLRSEVFSDETKYLVERSAKIFNKILKQMKEKK